MNGAFGPTGHGQNSFSRKPSNPSTPALNRALLIILNPKAKGISPGKGKGTLFTEFSNYPPISKKFR